MIFRLMRWLNQRCEHLLRIRFPTQNLLIEKGIELQNNLSNPGIAMIIVTPIWVGAGKSFLMLYVAM